MVGWLNWKKKGEGEAESSSDGTPDAEPLVHFTEPARAKLQELLSGEGGARGALRISVQNPGAPTPNYGMALEPSGEAGPGDVVVDGGGFRVLVDQQSLPQVKGATVDFVNDPLRPGFQVNPPAAPAAAPPAPRPDLDMSHPAIAAVQRVIEQQVNPGIASHGGRATLIDVKDDVVYVELGGGCQGCAMASVTLKQGVERLIKQAVPSVREVIDTTDHAGGRNPYFAQAKGGSSPFHQSAKG